jgi:hypothetical protein
VKTALLCSSVLYLAFDEMQHVALALAEQRVSELSISRVCNSLVEVVPALQSCTHSSSVQGGSYRAHQFSM